MARKTINDWFDAGLAVLAERGAPHLTIDALCGALSVTKGSFYHHFADFPAYKTALLAHIRTLDTDRIIAMADKAGTPEARLEALFSLGVNYPRALALAMQAWAAQDDEVRAVQFAVYDSQLRYAVGLLVELGLPRARARRVAELSLATLIGALHLNRYLPASAHAALLAELKSLWTHNG
jgi:AcrR family transcriptional regulator